MDRRMTNPEMGRDTSEALGAGEGGGGQMAAPIKEHCHVRIPANLPGGERVDGVEEEGEEAAVLSLQQGGGRLVVE